MIDGNWYLNLEYAPWARTRSKSGLNRRFILIDVHDLPQIKNEFPVIPTVLRSWKIVENYDAIGLIFIRYVLAVTRPTIYSLHVRVVRV